MEAGAPLRAKRDTLLVAHGLHLLEDERHAVAKVDDFAVVALENDDIEESKGLAVLIRDAIKRALKELGFGCHKETEGDRKRPRKKTEGH